MRWVRVRVLPEPGPATISSGPDPHSADAVAVLEKERSAAEQYAVLWASAGRKDVARPGSPIYLNTLVFAHQ
jgi:hypothetical protein